MNLNLSLRRLAIGVLLASALLAADPAYRQQIEAYRQQREKALKADGGWLTVTGLFWLKPGANLLGSAPDNDILLPEGSPAHLGQVILDGASARFIAAIDGVTYNGKPVKETGFSYANPSGVVTIGPLDLLLLKRGDRFAIRLKDRNSAIRKSFTHLNWYPVQEDWRIEARFVPHPSPTKFFLDTIIGGREEATSPGYVEFQRGGQTYRLLASGQGRRLSFVIRDGTSGKTTYGAARFLSADAPGADNVVILDFNKAENPPCAFTPYATCPLPPPQNRLSLAIEAGERKYEGSAH